MKWCGAKKERLWELRVFNDFVEVSTTSWQRNFCIWPLSMRLEQTAKILCCKYEMIVLSKIKTLLKKHEPFQEAPTFYQDPTDHCHCPKTSTLSECSGLLWLLFKIVSNCHSSSCFTSNSATLCEATPLVAAEILKGWAELLADSQGRGVKFGVQALLRLCSQLKRQPSPLVQVAWK